MQSLSGGGGQHRKTITLYKEGQPYELPLPFRERLHETLRRRWKETRGEPE